MTGYEYGYEYPDAICTMCGRLCPTWEEVHVGGGMGWELWCYCKTCKVDTFHPRKKLDSRQAVGKDCTDTVEQHICQFQNGTNMTIVTGRKDWYAAADLAALMGTTEPVIWRAMDRGLIPSQVMPGSGKWMVGHAELVAWLRDQPGMEPLAREVEGAGLT